MSGLLSRLAARPCGTWMRSLAHPRCPRAGNRWPGSTSRLRSSQGRHLPERWRRRWTHTTLRCSRSAHPRSLFRSFQISSPGSTSRAVRASSRCSFLGRRGFSSCTGWTAPSSRRLRATWSGMTAHPFRATRTPSGPSSMAISRGRREGRCHQSSRRYALWTGGPGWRGYGSPRPC